MEINISHLYPENLNLYGDTGNILCLVRRCEWRNIKVNISQLNIGDNLQSNNTDIYFMGGGQDSDQIEVVEDFHVLKRENLIKDLENGSVFLGVCGGYQLMGNEFLMGDGQTTRGLQIIDVTTRAPGIEVKQRCIGNLIAQINQEDYDKIRSIYTRENLKIPQTIVGFENHSGQTFIASDKVRPFAKTMIGFGNNSTEKIEGARYLNIFGSYMHGPFLPKNPHIADYLIWLALNRKYPEQDIKLDQLDDALEYQAHHAILKRFIK